MVTLSFPFWIVIGVQPESAPPLEVPKTANVFTSPINLVAYLGNHLGERWTVNTVQGHANLLIAIGDLQWNNIVNFCIDPNPDGTGGYMTPMEDALNQICGD